MRPNYSPPKEIQATTNSKHTLPVAENLLRQQFSATADQIWVTDITYISTDKGWLYLVKGLVSIIDNQPHVAQVV